MAYTLIWSQLSRDDLHDIVRYISQDSSQRAQAFAVRLVVYTESLRGQPEMGRIVPERRLRNIREIIFRPYRIVYRVDHRIETVEIIRVWHAARGTRHAGTTIDLIFEEAWRLGFSRDGSVS